MVVPGISDHFVNETRWLEPGHVGEKERNALVKRIVMTGSFRAEGRSAELQAGAAFASRGRNMRPKQMKSSVKFHTQNVCKTASIQRRT